MQFKLRVFTPVSAESEAEAEMIVIPCEGGDLGILARHAPLLAKLHGGAIKVRQKGGEHYFATSGGFAEVSDNVVSLFLDSFEAEEDIDRDRAKEAKLRAEERLKSKNEDIDYARATVALERALNRLKIAGG